MLHQSFLIQNYYEEKKNYDRPNQQSRSILINNFKIILQFHYHDWQGKN